MAEHESLFAQEIAEIPDVVARQIETGQPAYYETGARLARTPPDCFVTCARGTSDHAATYFKYLVETRLGIPVASIGPSVGSVYHAPLKLPRTVCLTISQSGGSPDILALQEHAQKGGAHAISLVNIENSPVTAAADERLPLLAGPEKAVAATKSYVASLLALAAFYAGFAGDDALKAAINALPETLQRALACDWTSAALPFAKATSHFVISRGPGMTIAGEAALKLKETCRLHAEAYSAAEVRHGPITLADAHLSALVFATEDQTRSSVLDAADAMREIGAAIFVADALSEGPGILATVPAPHPLLVPICQAVSFYRFVQHLAAELGRNPDAPPHLKKVTETT